MSMITRTDPIDGPYRWCRRCEEWWPDTPAFWYQDVRPEGAPYQSAGRIYRRPRTYVYPHCQTCRALAARNYRERRKGAAA